MVPLFASGRWSRTPGACTHPHPYASGSTRLSSSTTTLWGAGPGSVTSKTLWEIEGVSPAPLLETAAAALAAGDWDTARRCFDAALRQEPSPEALFGLGTALWWLGETDASVRAQEQAYAGFRRRADPPSAALAAVSLCLLYRASLGNYSASRGWVGRLARLVEQYELVPLRGWLALCRAVAANDTNEPAAAEAHAQQALDVARRTDDRDLELCALSELGTAEVQAGRVSQGAALLDEAMAGALGGEAERPETVVFTGCRSIIACSRAFEVERATQWIHAAEPFTRRFGGLHLYTTCRTQYGCLLFGEGHWEEAERELREALRIGQNAEWSLYGEALAKLAELRVAQGRLDEATELLKGFEDHCAATQPRALIHLHRGEPEVAAAILDRRLTGFGDRCLEATPLEELRAEAEIAVGDVESATKRATRLAGWAAEAGCRVAYARGKRVAGHARLAAGDADNAVRHLGEALGAFTELGLPYEAARTHLLLARAFGAAAQPTPAITEAQAALDRFESLNAGGADAAAAYLRELGVQPVRGGAERVEQLTRREQEVLALLAEGRTNREIAEQLFLSRKTIEHHVRSVMTKLGVGNRTEAAVYALRHPQHPHHNR
jgi:DNA-binding CsgD family transcriptional regulator